MLDELFDSVAAQGVDPELLLPVMGVREDYLAAALDRVGDLGGLAAYLELLGVTEAMVDRLRDRLTH